MSERLDLILAEKGLAKSRTAAQALIKEGSVTVNGRVVSKPSELCDPESDEFAVAEETALTRYVSRGGLKLETALEHFGIDLGGAVCLDIGASTGGFTDCMLKHGAARVYAVDVGTSQLDPRLRSDSRVISLENLDIREAGETEIPEKAGFVSIDVSFISLTRILPVTGRFTALGARCAALIKPQFELGRQRIGKSGVVKDPKLREKVKNEIAAFAESLGFKNAGVIPSGIAGGDGNIEYMMCLTIP
ncbi:MAG: TlyA family RNA methyltransferase [Ruminiclostridium sp.]|nr:TlyA family RNA methyltransferase [Ruminiclostridium sp.]